MLHPALSLKQFQFLTVSEIYQIYHPSGIYLFKVDSENTITTKRQQNDISDVVLVSLLLTLNIFHTFFLIGIHSMQD